MKKTVDQMLAELRQRLATIDTLSGATVEAGKAVEHLGKALSAAGREQVAMAKRQTDAIRGMVDEAVGDSPPPGPRPPEPPPPGPTPPGPTPPGPTAGRFDFAAQRLWRFAESSPLTHGAKMLVATDDDLPGSAFAWIGHPLTKHDNTRPPQVYGLAAKAAAKRGNLSAWIDPEGYWFQPARAGVDIGNVAAKIRWGENVIDAMRQHLPVVLAPAVHMNHAKFAGDGRTPTWNMDAVEFAQWCSVHSDALSPWWYGLGWTAAKWIERLAWFRRYYRQPIIPMGDAVRDGRWHSSWSANYAWTAADVRKFHAAGLSICWFANSGHEKGIAGKVNFKTSEGFIESKRLFRLAA